MSAITVSDLGFPREGRSGPELAGYPEYFVVKAADSVIGPELAGVNFMRGRFILRIQPRFFTQSREDFIDSEAMQFDVQFVVFAGELRHPAVGHKRFLDAIVPRDHFSFVIQIQLVRADPLEKVEGEIEVFRKSDKMALFQKAFGFVEISSPGH